MNRPMHSFLAGRCCDEGAGTDGTSPFSLVLHQPPGRGVRFPSLLGLTWNLVPPNATGSEILVALEGASALLMEGQTGVIYGAGIRLRPPTLM